MTYNRPYQRGVYGLIGDRYADGLNAICVVGDMLIDIDEFYSTVKTRDGYPCLKMEGRRKIRPGGAGAVHEMVQGLGENCLLATNHRQPSTKRRIIADGRVLCRIDEDVKADPIDDVPPAAVYLIADYAKGAVDQNVVAMTHRFGKRPVVADWHHSRHEDFYGAAILKSSWCKATIQTSSDRGVAYNGEWFFTPCDCVDPCGAGDMVLATVGVGLLRGMEMREICQWAAENAAKTCEVWGAVHKT